MEPEEPIATGAEAGAGDIPKTQETERTSQETAQPQSLAGTEVERTSETPTSKVNVESLNKIIDRRLGGRIEKAIERVLQEKLQEQLAPLIESTRNIPQHTPSQAEDAPDYNDLSGWINRRVEALLQERLNKELPKTIDNLKNQVTGELRSTAKTQEARNYLISQQDIGSDPEKLQEIREVMEKNLLHYALDENPLEATKIAVERWRASKTNPSVPPKSHLTTVTGGAGTSQGKRELTIAELKKLQDKISSNLTMDEQEKLGKEIESLVLER